jgi:hypothetical protein
VRLGLTLLCLVLACRPKPPAEHRSEAALGRPLAEAPVIREATVVAFWLVASDTLAEGHGADLLDDFRSYTAQVAPLLDQQGIALVATTADSLIVELENGPTRTIRLSGLDYPFGYVLVEPGYPESILTGVSTDEELLDQVTWYFGLDEAADSTGGRRRVVWYRVPQFRFPSSECGAGGPESALDTRNLELGTRYSVSQHLSHPRREGAG